MTTLDDLLKKFSLMDDFHIVVWADTSKEMEVVPSVMELKVTKLITEEQRKNIVRAINNVLPVLGIMRGCQFYKCDSITNFALKKCKGCSGKKKV